MLRHVDQLVVPLCYVSPPSFHEWVSAKDELRHMYASLDQDLPLKKYQNMSTFLLQWQWRGSFKPSLLSRICEWTLLWWVGLGVVLHCPTLRWEKLASVGCSQGRILHWHCNIRTTNIETLKHHINIVNIISTNTEIFGTMWNMKHLRTMNE